MTETKILLDYEEGIYYVCLMCGAIARTRQALRIHSMHYHTNIPKMIPLNKAIYWADREIEKMRELEKQGKYNRNWIVEDDPNLHDELAKANIIDSGIEYNEMVTPEIFAKAIKNSFASAGMEMDYNDALQIAEYLLSFFGYDDAIIENYFEDDDRQILYQLEEFELIRFEKIEHPIIREIFSKQWVTSNVVLNYSKIFEMANKGQIAIEENAENIYEKLPEEAWIR